jgi:hypothetical protein
MMNSAGITGINQRVYITLSDEPSESSVSIENHLLSALCSDWKIDCKPVENGMYQHTFTAPSQSTQPISLTLTPTEYGMRHFIPEIWRFALERQIVAEVIICDLREAFPSHVWQSHLARQRSAHRAKLRKRRKIRHQQRRRRRGLA